MISLMTLDALFKEGLLSAEAYKAALDAPDPGYEFRIASYPAYCYRAPSLHASVLTGFDQFMKREYGQATLQPAAWPEPAATPSVPSAKSEGLTCGGCKEYYPYAEPNQPDGTLRCFACRL